MLFLVTLESINDSFLSSNGKNKRSGIELPENPVWLRVGLATTVNSNFFLMLHYNQRSSISAVIFGSLEDNLSRYSLLKNT